MSNSQQKPSWSLQDNKRSEKEREAFKPTGKTKKNSNLKYVLAVILVAFLVSLALTLGSDKKLEACLFSEFCFNSKDDVFLYATYVFSTITIIGLTVFVAYVFGKRFGEQIKN